MKRSKDQIQIPHVEDARLMYALALAGQIAADMKAGRSAGPAGVETELATLRHELDLALKLEGVLDAFNRARTEAAAKRRAEVSDEARREMLAQIEAARAAGLPVARVVRDPTTGKVAAIVREALP